MDGVQLRDEAAQDRVRAAIEFLDPSEYSKKLCPSKKLYGCRAVANNLFVKI